MSPFLEVKHSDAAGNERNLLAKARKEGRKLLIFATEDDLIEQSKSKPVADLNSSDLKSTNQPFNVSHRYELRIGQNIRVIKNRP